MNLKPDANHPSSDRESYSIDGINMLERQVDVGCPRCADQQLRIGMLAGSKLAACMGCHGCLAQSGVLATLVRVLRGAYSGEDIDTAPINPDELHVACHCPACLQPMETHAYGGPGNVVIDSCASCNLVWLDASELTQIIQAPGDREPVAGVPSIEEHIVASLQPTRSTAEADLTLSVALAAMFGGL